MMTRVPVSVLVGLVIPVSAFPQDPVNAANWMTHPAIVEIRGIYTAIETALSENRLEEQTKAVECYGRSVGLRLTMFTDSTGTVRKYVKRGGSGDAGGEVRYYYDAAGALRFVLELYRHHNGTSRELRVYYDAEGNRIYVDRRLLAGPGYIGGFQLKVLDPAAAFADPC